MGQQTLSVLTDEGEKLKTVFQIAEIARPLSSVSRICDKNSVVILGRKGRVIMSLDTGNKIPFKRKGDTHELKMWATAAGWQGFMRLE